jgi:hypothetical protein
MALTLQGFSQDVNKLIKQNEVEQTIKALAADDMQGRGLFTPGIEKAAQYIEKEFKEAGLKPLPMNNGYRQNFTLIKSTPVKTSVIINGDSVAAENRIIVSGGAFNWDNNNGVQVIKMRAGKSFFDEYLAILRSNKNTIVLVGTEYEALFKHFQKNVERESVTVKGKNQSAQVFLLNSANDIKSFKVSYEAKSKELPLCNIAGIIQGKTKPDEYVIFSGHYDHLGIIKTMEGDSIANGADDDASGTTGVITLAKYYKKLNNNARSLIFVAFTAEEIGLYGSQYFATQINPDKVVSMFNMEMMGLVSKFGANTAFITGFDRSNFGQILQRNIQGAGSIFKFYPDPYLKLGLFYRSDNATLARMGVPAHTVSTVPLDIDKYYHTVKDEVSTLDMNNLTATIRAIALGSGTIVSGKDTPTRVAKAE